MQKTSFGPGSLSRLKPLLNSLTPNRILLVTGCSSFETSGASRTLSTILEQYQFDHFRCVSKDPNLDELEAGLAMSSGLAPDVIVGIGGGRVLDMAKLIRIGNAQNCSIEEIAHGQQTIEHRGPPLIAVPTTAGSGSQATHFAVLYIDGIKYSIAHSLMKPEYVLVDSELTYSLPELATATTGLDAICQAIESYWSVNSTRSSRTWAKDAITSLLGNIELSVHTPSPKSRENMCRASHLAGRAIDITKTTGPHALSYGLADVCNIPHGHSVGLTLGGFLEFNAGVTDNDINDPRGVSHVHQVVGEICGLLGEATPIEARVRFTSLMEAIGLATRLSELGIDGAPTCRFLATEVNKERLNNNPRQPTQRQLEEILEEIL
jgi:alcohol dehydrogenase class IV